MIAFDAPDRPLAPCEDIGLADLFTSPFQADHQLAAVYCNKGRRYNPDKPECVFLVACKKGLDAEIAAATGFEGTRAGELVGSRGGRRPGAGRPKKKAAA
jgi:hypothetical protein